MKANILIGLFVISVLLIIVGAVADVMHWPRSKDIFIAGIVLWFVMLAYLIYYVRSRRREKMKNENSIN